MSEWLSRSDDGLYEQCINWGSMLEDEGARATFNWNAAECESVVLSISVYMGALETYRKVNSTSNRILKDEKKKQAIAAIRAFAAAYVRYNPLMDDAKRFQLGIRPRDTTPTVHARPTSQPSVTVENTINYFEHRLKASNHETGTAVRPADAYGVRFAWKVGGERPASGEELTKSRFSRKTSVTVTYTEVESGMAVYYAACYENSRGEAGPWSPVIEAQVR